MIESRCGLICSECAFFTNGTCSGCTAISKPFWGESCPVKSCAEGRTYAHCGQCDAFPCETLNAFAYDKEQGDDGARIAQCRAWKERGVS